MKTRRETRVERREIPRKASRGREPAGQVCDEPRRKRRTANRLALLAMASASVVGCGPHLPVPDEPFLLAKARAAVAFAEAELARARPAEPRTTCAECEGTGTIPSGDGLARVSCDCAAGCRCKPPSAPTSTTAAVPPAPRRKRLLYFTAAWCPACRRNEPTFAALRARGWTIGPGAENHVQTIDLDENPHLRTCYKVAAVPTWVLIEDARELRRRQGVLDPFTVGRLFDD